MPILEEIVKKNKRKQASAISFQDLIREVKEAFINVAGVPLKEKVGGPEIDLTSDRDLTRDEVMQLTLSAIPEIAVTELGWTKVTTPEDGEGQEISAPARQQLMNFLNNVQGADLEDKLRSLAQFYNSDTGMVAIEGVSPQERIKNLFSYLVFYKTLTKVISNFNAASAGFSFESFLSVLTNGKQIKANTGTIADFQQGNGVPISLKLYQEAAVHVGGSFVDLVGDLTEPQFAPHDYMQYLVVLKDFAEGGMKEGLDIKGTLKWYRWNFTLDNVANIIGKTSEKYNKCIQFPMEFIQRINAGEDFDYAATLPALTNLPSPEKLETEFIANLDQELKNAGIALGSGNPESDDPVEQMSQVERILQAIDYAKSDSSFNDADPKKFGGVEQGVIRGVSTFNYRLLFAKVRELLPEKPYREQQGVWKAITNANAAVINRHAASKKTAERNKILSRADLFASVQDSVEFYNALPTPELKKLALKNSRGVLATLQFSMNRGQVYDVDRLAQPFSALPEGQEDVFIGELNIGRSYVADILKVAIQEMNDSLFELFRSVQVIVRDSQAFVATGLDDDTLAQSVIQSADDVSTRIEDKITI